jgi:hypothetical protein
MTYAELVKEDYSYILFQQFLCNCVLHKQTPFKAIQYDSDKNSQTLVVFKQSESGTISTRNLHANKVDMVFIRQWLSQSFPNCEFEELAVNSDVGRECEKVVL